MQVILNNGKETIDFTSIILKQMSGELTREQVQEPGINNSGSDDDPYVETTPENSINYLSETK